MEKSHLDVAGKVVVVAIKATSKEVSKTALVWALTHVAQPGDHIKLLVVIPSHHSSKWLRGFSRFTSDCAIGHLRTPSETLSDQKDDIVHSCSQMVHQLHGAYEPLKIKVRIKALSGLARGIVATEAKKVQSNWVILDKHLKDERKNCLEELQCNVVLMKKSQPKVLRLNLMESPKINTTREAWISSHELDVSQKCLKSYFDESAAFRGPDMTPVSTPDVESPLTVTDVGTSSISSSDVGSSSLFSGFCGSLRNESRTAAEGGRNLSGSECDSENEKQTPSVSYFQRCMVDIVSSRRKIQQHVMEESQNVHHRPPASTRQGLVKKMSTLSQDPNTDAVSRSTNVSSSRNIRNTVSLSRKAPLGPPPLCSMCQHKAPAFGNPPRWFTYGELEVATSGFAQTNFLAEGGYGSVHRGILPDGQVVAVKQYKLASTQGDQEFCSEVEVLSCAQHRNVVMLIGFCVEGGRRLLVYEYICNGSLDSHLYGRNRDPLKWSARQKIAVGAARGLRYLHEECRVGCIVHRDIRPNNILLTHDFEPLVGDFGLARWQPDGDLAVETRILGRFGYLAPEYAQSGQITEKADTYSFGVVLLELVTGRKAIDLNRPKGQQCLTEWARKLLRKNAISELVDPCLMNCYSDEEVHRMLRCASLCIKHDPYIRPRMSQVLRVLEGDIVL
ncbi:inactive protein kinase SELMODRAFT_444075-like isoform X2 [Cucurbita moschata]|uniref:Inactive protein kinase SELMODRAFT_444075-like isoform X2 n=1 Tax=Cucurbita moschata TaxID=3662 RepID=A0A6J1F6F0_CUCMO|nr:inactive protein kinase SELMODRAFT_444075-like isoform X2 [Cucurbita moschata]